MFSKGLSISIHICMYYILYNLYVDPENIFKVYKNWSWTKATYIATYGKIRLMSRRKIKWGVPITETCKYKYLWLRVDYSYV